MSNPTLQSYSHSETRLVRVYWDTPNPFEDGETKLTLTHLAFAHVETYDDGELFVAGKTFCGTYFETEWIGNGPNRLCARCVRAWHSHADEYRLQVEYQRIAPLHFPVPNARA